MPTPDFIPLEDKVTQKHRITHKGHAPFVVWFTGLSGSGKSTLANTVENKLHQNGYHTYLLDGDNVRKGLTKDLDFSDQGRVENIRRISEVSNLFADAGIITLTAFISPFRSDRDLARELIGDKNFIEVHIDCPLEVCERRDVKGLYAKARRGEILNFTGINSPYEPPHNPEIVINTHNQTIKESTEQLFVELIKLMNERFL